MLNDMPAVTTNANLQDDDDISMITILSVDNISEIDETYQSENEMCTSFSGRTYGLTFTSDNNRNNLQYEIPAFDEPPLFSNFDIDPPNCENCLRNIKNENYYRLKFYESLRIIKFKEREISNLKRHRNNYKQQLNRYRFKKSIIHITKPKYVKGQIHKIINQLTIHENSKTFCKMLTNKRSKNEKWPDDQKLLAQNIYYRSSAAYKYLRENLKLNLPSKTSLVRWQPVKHLSPGFNLNILSNVKEKFSSMSEHFKHVVLIFDEVYIKSDLVYNIYSDQIDGFVDFGTERQDRIGKIICCFMIRSIISNWKFVLSYFVSSESITSDKLYLLIMENLDKCKELGVKVRAVTCDQGSSNRKSFKMCGMTSTKPFFQRDDQQIIGIYDPPHLIKSVRNTLMKSDLKCPDGIISWNTVKALYNLEQDSVTKCCPRISKKHIYPNTFEKMRVKLAVQVLSGSVAAGIKTAVQLGKFDNDDTTIAISTYKFIEKFDKLFDCLNSKSKYSKNKFAGAYMLNNEITEFLKYMVDYILKIKVVKKTTVYCFDGLVQTINGIIELALQIKSENCGIEYLLTARLNQDPIENMFSQIRAANGHNKNPSVYEFNHNIAKLTTIKILNQFSNNTNCEEDSDESLRYPADVAELIEKEINSVPIGVLEVPGTNEYEFDMEDVSDISDNFINFDIEDISSNFSDASMRYYVGYVAFKMIKKLKCGQCEHIFFKLNDILEVPSEYLIHHKNHYKDESDLGRLRAPTDNFFEICKAQICMFGRMFQENAQIKHLKERIVKLCIHNTSIKFPNFYNDENPCCEHNKLTLNFMILVLIRKHCSWLAEKFIKGSYKNTRNPNWRILLQGK